MGQKNARQSNSIDTLSYLIKFTIMEYIRAI